MKHFFCLVMTIGFSLQNSFTQATCELLLEGNNLSGQCDHRFITAFNIELDSVYTEIGSVKVFDLLPRIGSIRFKDRVDIPTEFTLTERAGFPQVMFRFRTDYYTFDGVQADHKSIRFEINTDPSVPVTDNDLNIIKLAQDLLSEEQYWNPNDDRDCVDDLANKSYSIYCAIRIASLQIENKYNHRNAILQKLRHLIEEKYPDKEWNHRLMDFNNMKEIAYANIMEMLGEIEQECISELNRRK